MRSRVTPKRKKKLEKLEKLIDGYEPTWRHSDFGPEGEREPAFLMDEDFVVPDDESNNHESEESGGENDSDSVPEEPEESGFNRHEKTVYGVKCTSALKGTLYEKEYEMIFNDIITMFNLQTARRSIKAKTTDTWFARFGSWCFVSSPEFLDYVSGWKASLDAYTRKEKEDFMDNVAHWIPMIAEWILTCEDLHEGSSVHVTSHAWDLFEKLLRVRSFGQTSSRRHGSAPLREDINRTMMHVFLEDDVSLAMKYDAASAKIFSEYSDIAKDQRPNFHRFVCCWACQSVPRELHYRLRYRLPAEKVQEEAERHADDFADYKQDYAEHPKKRQMISVEGGSDDGDVPVRCRLALEHVSNNTDSEGDTLPGNRSRRHRSAGNLQRHDDGDGDDDDDGDDNDDGDDDGDPLALHTYRLSSGGSPGSPHARDEVNGAGKDDDRGSDGGAPHVRGRTRTGRGVASAEKRTSRSGRGEESKNPGSQPTQTSLGSSGSSARKRRRRVLEDSESDNDNHNKHADQDSPVRITAMSSPPGSGETMESGMSQRRSRNVILDSDEEDVGSQKRSSTSAVPKKKQEQKNGERCPKRHERTREPIHGEDVDSDSDGGEWVERKVGHQCYRRLMAAHRIRRFFSVVCASGINENPADLVAECLHRRDGAIYRVLLLLSAEYSSLLSEAQDVLTVS